MEIRLLIAVFPPQLTLIHWSPTTGDQTVWGNLPRFVPMDEVKKKALAEHTLTSLDVPLTM